MGSRDSQQDVNGVDWKNEMLKRLKDSAPPVPFMVACMTTMPNKPEYLGEEYHGQLTKESEKKLLDGSSGRFIVRESRSNPGKLTLAFNYNDEIQQVKLTYNSRSRTFSTDGIEKEFPTTRDLMTAVLEFYKKLKVVAPNKDIGSPKVGGYKKFHHFKDHTYLHPKWCDHCGKFLWGLSKQGRKCDSCGYNVHTYCAEEAALSGCGSSSRRPSDRRRSSSKDGSTSSNPISPTQSKSFAVKRQSTRYGDCLYFKNCSIYLYGFLSSLVDEYINVTSDLTKCFCNDCLSKLPSAKNKDKTLDLCNTNLNDWTRFELFKLDDAAKRNTKNWDTAFLAIKPHFLVDLLKTLYNPNVPGDPDFELIVAPSLAYIFDEMAEAKWAPSFTDSSAISMSSQIILELYVRNNSYTVTAQELVVDNNCNKESNEEKLSGEKWRIHKEIDIYPKAIMVKLFKKE